VRGGEGRTLFNTVGTLPHISVKRVGEGLADGAQRREVFHFGRKKIVKRTITDRVKNCNMLLCRGTWGSLGVNHKKPVCRCSSESGRQMAFIARGMEYRSRGVLLQLYRVLVRPHLEYCVRFSSPYLRKDILALEGGAEKVHQVDSRDEGGLTYGGEIE